MRERKLAANSFAAIRCGFFLVFPELQHIDEKKIIFLRWLFKHFMLQKQILLMNMLNVVKWGSQSNITTIKLKQFYCEHKNRLQRHNKPMKWNDEEAKLSRKIFKMTRKKIELRENQEKLFLAIFYVWTNIEKFYCKAKTHISLKMMMVGGVSIRIEKKK